jgi:VWFA-related protein
MANKPFLGLGTIAFMAVGLVALCALTPSLGLGAAIRQSANDKSPAQDSAQPQYTIQARVPLTIVDVVVTDAKGKPVHGLKQSDFTVLEDGHEMKPASFDEHRTDEATSATPTQVEQKLPPNTFTNVTPTPPTARPINILLVDSLDTPVATQTIIQQRMIGFVDKLAPGSRLSVMSLSEMGRLSILQGFTSDHELLKAAIHSKKITGLVPPIEDSWQDPLGTDSVDQDEECNRAALRGQYTLRAMHQMARYLSGMFGRKNLIWFSGAFPLRMYDKMHTVCYDFSQDLKNADDQLSRAHVVLYPVDPRALDLLAKFGATSPPVMQQAQEHLTIESIAEETGGKAYYNNNDLAALSADAIDNGSNFYTITYTPVNQTLDTRFRTITVKVDQPGLNLVYRNGYYAVVPDVTLSGKKVEKVSTMQAAMMRGALNATQVLFHVTVAQAPGTEATLPADNQPDAKQMKPPYRHYTVSYSIDVHGIDFATSRDGNYRGNFEYGVRVYNADGDEIVNSVSTTVSPILPPTVYRSMLRTGANASQQIDVPATGDYFLRIAVHDLASDRVGAIEVPTSSIAHESASAVAGQK